MANDENDSVNQKARELLNTILKAKKELFEIQNKCRHPKYKIDLVKGSLMRRCQTCYRAIGYPNKKDLKDSGYI
jgi:hypothetical protein